jgi:hypothetical protein
MEPRESQLSFCGGLRLHHSGCSGSATGGRPGYCDACRSRRPDEHDGAVRRRLTTRASAVPTAWEIALVYLDPSLEFAIKLVIPTAGPQPPAVALTREIMLELQIQDGRARNR